MKVRQGEDDLNGGKKHGNSQAEIDGQPKFRLCSPFASGRKQFGRVHE